MITLFLIILGIFTLFGLGNASDACLTVLLLKIVLPLLFLIGLLLLLRYN